jgi:DNA-directed RNA polymerase beta' subunit
MQVHVPVMPEAVQEAKGLTLSNMLLGDQWKSQTTVAPQHEAVAALYRASSAEAKGKTRKFKSQEEAMAAYHRGEITLSTPVAIG